MAPKEEIKFELGEMVYGKMTPEMERMVLASLQSGGPETMAHIYGHNDPNHTLSMLQRVALKQVCDYYPKMQKYDDYVELLRSQIRETEAILGPRVNLRKVIQDQSPAMALAAEFKRASPSKGDIAVHLDAGEQATKYFEAGASIISVLTEEYWFKGTLKDLREIREATQNASESTTRQRPAILRKEFVVNNLQIYEAAAAGADTILLIVAIIPSDKLKEYIDCCRSLDMEPLVEVHAPEELDVALNAGAKVIGVNNRNLHTFQLDLATTDRTAAELTRRGLRFHHTLEDSAEYALCSLSGMSHAEDVDRYRQAGVGMVLIGEALMRSPDPRAAIKSLCLDPADYANVHPEIQHGAAYTGGTKVIKVCGITNATDATLACRAGASLIGVIFVPNSKRCVTVDRAKEIVQAVRAYGERTERIKIKNASDADVAILPALTRNTRALQAAATSRMPLVVGVFQNENCENISQIVQEVGLDLVQLHGDEGMEACNPAKCGGVPAIRVVHMPPDKGDAFNRARAIVDSFTSSYPQAILLDTSVKGAQGGTGVTFDWNVAQELQTTFGLPVLVAGGLTAENIQDIVTNTKPWGVDVSSGVESMPGQKDRAKVEAFVAGARHSATEASKGF